LNHTWSNCPVNAKIRQADNVNIRLEPASRGCVVEQSLQPMASLQRAPVTSPMYAAQRKPVDSTKTRLINSSSASFIAFDVENHATFYDYPKTTLNSMQSNI